jgi:hypothetical protein
MLTLLAENLKLILLLAVIATIVGLSWFGNDRRKRDRVGVAFKTSTQRRSRRTKSPL